LALDHLPYDQRAEMSILSAAERSAQLAGEDPASLTEPEDVDPEALAQSAPVEQPSPSQRDGHEHDGHDGHDGLDAAPRMVATPAPSGAHTTTELIESQQGRTADAPLCLTCGTKMRPAGSCYVCEGCGSTSGCS
jgi:ribonucleoside-diphosphate reductase alpha chain